MFPGWVLGLVKTRNRVTWSYLLTHNMLTGVQFWFCQGHSFPDHLNLGPNVDQRTEFQRKSGNDCSCLQWVSIGRVASPFPISRQGCGRPASRDPHQIQQPIQLRICPHSQPLSNFCTKFLPVLLNVIYSIFQISQTFIWILSALKNITVKWKIVCLFCNFFLSFFPHIVLLKLLSYGEHTVCAIGIKV